MLQAVGSYTRSIRISYQSPLRKLEISKRRAKDCDAGLYEYIPPKSQFETNAVMMSFPQAVIDLV